MSDDAMRKRAIEVFKRIDAECLENKPHSSVVDIAIDAMLAFAAEVAAATREECARVCEDAHGERNGDCAILIRRLSAPAPKHEDGS